MSLRLGEGARRRRRRREDLPLSPTAKEVVAAAGTEQQRLGHSNIATQHLLLALLTACRQKPGWFRKGTELRVQQLLTKHGITPELTESKTNSGIVTPSTWVLDDRLVALNAQIAALAELLVERHIFTRAEFVALLDQNEGPLVTGAFLLPLIEALAKNGALSVDEQKKIEAATAKLIRIGVHSVDGARGR